LAANIGIIGRHVHAAHNEKGGYTGRVKIMQYQPPSAASRLPPPSNEGGYQGGNVSSIAEQRTVTAQVTL